ncbi:hypothetical protein P3H15_28135 [Rhodococcus sp. T2V]|uniref:hypothetical protein n=1 Tax=Rhodococcus sp. T2V TaxID=3034164 RepID=UPI0023E1BD97|nr:hypothetical protein [Rhodococcus sp. T2V]MDF3308888.1 hypothetical protein [Rhodococcus sp. T2V]
MNVVSDPTAESEFADFVEEATGPLSTNGHAPEASGPETHAESPGAVPPIALPKLAVQAAYRATVSGFDLELRVDVDGVRPTKRVSGDFFTRSGATVSYFGSFVVNAVTVTTTADEVKVEGRGAFTWSAANPFVRVTIPRVTILQQRKPATLTFLNAAGVAGASYVCPFASRYLRTVQWEQDSVAGTVPFISYDTGSLSGPAGSPARVLTVSKAYQETGIDLQVAGAPNVVPVGSAGSDAKWTDAELHAAMVNHFSLHADRPQWRVWLLVATTHVGGYRGIMFDYSDSFQRQGCAVLYDAIKGTDADSQRAALRTYVHELGHAFNLLHSWQKNLADPPAPLGPNNGFGDLSWMNYVQNYNSGTGQAGAAAYWAAFPFQFTDNELVHLRHGFYKNVVMGANSFGKGAAEIDPDMFDEPLVDNSGLALELRSKGAFEYGEPVVAEIKLSTNDLRGRETHGYLHPNDDFVSIAIRQPTGRTVVFRPMMRRCADESRVIRLDGSRPAIYESAYIGFGRDGHMFEQPGLYQLRAQYLAADGSRVVSPVTELRVRRPMNREDELVGELLLGDEQGQLLALLGSDSAVLQSGNDALGTLLDEHAEHPLTVYARLVKGVNAARDFKLLTPQKTITVRDADTTTAISMLKQVEQASTADAGVDNITLNMAMHCQARAEARAGHTAKVEKVLDRMVDIFRSKDLKNEVLETITAEAKTAKSEIVGEETGA